MKKLIAILALSAVGVAAFAQGEFTFAGPGARGIWDDFTTPSAPKLATDMDVAFLFGSTAATPLVDAIYASTATNGSTALTANQITTAWTDILTDPSFMLATNDNGGSPVLAVGGLSSANGSYAYTPPGGSLGGAFAVDGTSSTGGNYHIFVIGWNNAYATPQAAAAAGSAVGWSQVFTYNAVAGPNPGPAGSPGNFLSAAGAVPLQFGVETAPTPEPTTIALAGLGGLALLGLRRRK